MKTRFSTLDICAILPEINKRASGMRLVNVYDIDHKTYLFKLTRTDEKIMLLVESGTRMHLSDFDWPKNPMPSGFSVKGCIIQKAEKRSEGELLTNIEFHPFLFEQHKTGPHLKVDSFNKAVDDFYGSLESQKSDMKALQKERAAMKKLENVRRDHETRLEGLRKEQDVDKQKAFIIEANLDLVDQAIKVICSAIANQVDWNEIRDLVADAQVRGDPVAKAIKSLKLETNSMVMALSEPGFDDDDDDSDFLDSSDEEAAEQPQKPKSKPHKVDIDLSLSAYANAQRYYNKKRHAAQKEQRTIDASSKAFKSAEKKTKQTLKEAATVQNIQKARKVFWFEKFLWFISSENYLVIGGRDAQQNEILVKKYFGPDDIYVHADLHGATSCIIKNPSGAPVPPKTLNEAGTMAICHSAAWDAKVVTSAWWVFRDQVSKTAPSGEYLTTGSFLIRGKKNFLPPSYLVYGFGFLFKVDETCVWKHKNERRIRQAEEESTIADDASEELEILSQDEEDKDGKHEILEVKTPLGKTVPQEEDIDQAIKTVADHRNESSTEKITDNALDELQNEEHSLKDNSDATGIKDVKVTAQTDPAKGSIVSFDYPDTIVKLQYETDDRYQLATQENTDEKDDETVVYLGDDVPVPFKVEKANENSSKPKLSAKQRREQKKMRKTQHQETAQPPASSQEPRPKLTHQKEVSIEQQPEQNVAKRGKKNKLKKIKEKYKDQDEEDKKLMMEILQSAKAPKNKDKKGKSKEPEVKKKPPGPQHEKKVHQQRENIAQGEANANSDEEKELVLKAEHLTVTQVDDILDTLTGIPAADDLLLFAIPVCAPYNTMQNYKFKVKLTPGTGKKGKAAKTALNMFQISRDTTQQEKDHFRSVKDHDLSRNMPGKVKVSAPNLQKQKFKGRRR
ncbi:ribosome quality control complex subunit NEMF-like isoform X2 [Clavelina lepadiformis]|uniref:ribosome quality control complex subunit NEMF-like isoform X2 n=1 Tax=Clavelina lepadiformis TaxID=159417 RepID=UPI00404115F1